MRSVDCGQHNLISRKQMICCLHWPAGNVFITWPGLSLCQKYWMQSTITNSYLVYSPAVSQEFYEKLKPRFVTAALAMHSEYESPQCTGGYSQATSAISLSFYFHEKNLKTDFFPRFKPIQSKTVISLQKLPVRIKSLQASSVTRAERGERGEWRN